MSSILPFIANCTDVPRHLQDQITRLIPITAQSPLDAQINLLSPCQSSPQLPKSKWALIFLSERELNAFIKEIDQSEEKQFRLSIEEYSVFGNVMFAFMRRQYKISVWVQHIRDIVLNQPLGVFIFHERFRQLVELVEKGTAVFYNVELDYHILDFHIIIRLNGVMNSYPGGTKGRMGMMMGRRRNLVRHNNEGQELNTMGFPDESLTSRVMCSIVMKRRMQGGRSPVSIHEPMRTCRTTSPNTDALNRPMRASLTQVSHFENSASTCSRRLTSSMNFSLILQACSLRTIRFLKSYKIENNNIKQMQISQALYESFNQSVDARMKIFSNQYGKLQNEVNLNCYEYAKGKIDGFVECMEPEIKRSNQIKQLFDFRMAQNQGNVIDCFKAEENLNQDFQKCKQNGETVLASIMKDFRTKMTS